MQGTSKQKESSNPDDPSAGLMDLMKVRCWWAIEWNPRSQHLHDLWCYKERRRLVMTLLRRERNKWFLAFGTRRIDSAYSDVCLGWFDYAALLLLHKSSARPLIGHRTSANMVLCLSLLQNLYNDGDDDMKRTIAKVGAGCYVLGSDCFIDWETLDWKVWWYDCELPIRRVVDLERFPSSHGHCPCLVSRLD